MLTEARGQAEVDCPRHNTTSVKLGGLSLRRNFTWTFAGNLIYAACQWAVLVVIAKMTTPAAVGQFALGLAITAPILIFAAQGLRDLQATDAHQHFEFRHYLGYRLVSVTLALVGIVVLTQAIHYPAVVIVVGISKALESISELMYGKYQQHERMDWIATSLMLRGVFSVIAVAVLLHATYSIAWGAAGLIVANAGVLIFYDWRQPGWLFRSPELGDRHTSAPKGISGSSHISFPRTIFRLAMLGLPLGLAQMLNSFSVNVPRYFLERHAGEASLGIFAAIMYLLVAGRTVIAALAQSCVARLARWYANGDDQAFRSLLFKQLLLALGFGAAGIIFSMVCGGPFLRLIYRPEYAEYTSVLLLTMVISAINYLAEFTGTALTAARSIRVQPIILGTCVLVGWVSSAVLVPRYGILGASWGVLLIGVCQLFLYICALVYTFQRRGLERRRAMSPA